MDPGVRRDDEYYCAYGSFAGMPMGEAGSIYQRLGMRIDGSGFATLSPGMRYFCACGPFARDGVLESKIVQRIRLTADGGRFLGGKFVISIAVALLLGQGTAEGAQGGAPIAETVGGFLVQNVCVDGAGRVEPGRSPLDGAAGCPHQRDLRAGEALPYHKHDHPSPEQAAADPLGYQRHDSYPVETAGLGTVVEHSFDFGTGGGRRFGIFDRGADGGDVAVINGSDVSFGATEDGGSGFVLWVGDCRGEVTPAALARSWLIIEFDPAHPQPMQGQSLARLNGVPGGRTQCPSRLNAALTTWRTVPFAYRAGPGQGTPVTLTSLISEHYGGADRDTADHVERFYFTRELGGTRWERWQNARGNKQFGAATVAERARWFAATGRCSPADPPAGSARMVLVDCREWTRIVPSADPAGDAPGFWIDAIRARPQAPEFFQKPNPATK
jgi:hypothetical protein